MSANNQTLIKEHNGKWYVFVNVNAESWTKRNTLSIKEADGVYNKRIDALSAAWRLDENWGQFGEGTEYGVQEDVLFKDGAEVEIIEEK
jgi:hypothetical protein